jgi:hypothetical protein
MKATLSVALTAMLLDRGRFPPGQPHDPVTPAAAATDMFVGPSC